MEESVDSSVRSRDFCSQDCLEVSGESSWTMYFEDFMTSQERTKATGAGALSLGSAAVDTGSSSVVSDAGSCVASNTSSGLQAPSGGYEKLMLKRRRAWGLLQDDDPLEDTATSPVNSPKVSELSHTAMGTKKREDDHRDIPDLEGDVRHRNGPEQNKELSNGFNCIENWQTNVRNFRKEGFA